MLVTRSIFQVDADRYSFDFNVPRSLGCHLSSVIEYIVNKDYADQSSVTTQANFLSGFVWERVMARQAIEVDLSGHRSGLMRPGQLMWCVECSRVLWGREKSELHCLRHGHHGIFATPDAVMVFDWCYLEWKFTKKSLRSAGGDVFIPFGGVPQKELSGYEHISAGIPGWIYQVKGYCFLLDTLVGRIDGCFVEGDYGLTTRDSTTVRYDIEFTRIELEENWSMIVTNAIDGGLLDATAV